MSRLAIFMFIVSFLNAKMLVRIESPLEETGLPKGLDIAGMRPGEWVDVVVTEEELTALRTKGFILDVLTQDIESLERGMASDYLYYSDIVDSILYLANAYPFITELETLGITYEGREILALKISDNAGIEEDEPGLLFMGLHHAREWPSVNVALFIADTLLKAYGQDQHITGVVDSNEIWILPCLNADGYVYSHDLGHDWRKNRRPVDADTGVDINRNYSGSNDGEPGGEWGSILSSSTSHQPWASVYCGPYPFSEAETQAIRGLVLSHNIILTVSYHTYGEMVLWPWGYTYSPPPDEMLSEIGTVLASKIQRRDGGSYTPYQSSYLYPTTGDATDWLYGYSLYIDGRFVVPFTIELADEFQPASSYLDTLERENFNGALYLMETADSIQDIVATRVIPPVINPIGEVSPPYTVIWLPQNPWSETAFYELDELTGDSIFTDDVEETIFWDSQRFTTSNARYHSPSHSWYSNTISANKVAAITTFEPVPVGEGDSLTFWIWYSIEDGWDYAFVEVSKDGRGWDILDSFTGSSDWIRRAYSLGGYSGGSIFIRFRYVTDDYIEYEGVYIDDIYPVSKFDSVVVLSNTIADTFYTVDSNPSGIYYYRVRGFNARGWGDFSELRKAEVITGVAETSPRVVPYGLALYQGISNPFRERVLLRYSIPYRMYVNLSIYDVRGEKVCTLRSGVHPPGLYRVYWDGRDSRAKALSSGVYFCLLKTNAWKSLRLKLVKF